MEKFKKLFSDAYHNMHEHQPLTKGTVRFHKASAVIDIGATLDNLVNMATTDRDIMSKISAAKKGPAWTNINLKGQLEELTSQLKVAIKVIQEMSTSSGKIKKTSRTVDLDYNPGCYCWTHG